MGGSSGESSEAAGDTAGFYALVAVGAAFFVGPWASLEAVQMRWGVVACILGGLYLLISVATQFAPYGFALTGISWVLYAEWRLGYWRLVIPRGGDDPRAGDDSRVAINSLDQIVVGLFGALLVLLLVSAVVGVALYAAYLPALLLNGLVIYFAIARGDRRAMAQLTDLGFIARLAACAKDKIALFDSPTPPTPDQVAKSIPRAATVRDLGTVGNWDVKVTKVLLNGNAQIKQANTFNETPNGQYVLVTYQATYKGPERMADARVDLNWSFTGTNSHKFYERPVVTPSENEEWPTTARRRGTARGQVAFDLPKNLIKGGVLTVEGYDENFKVVHASFVL